MTTLDNKYNEKLQRVYDVYVNDMKNEFTELEDRWKKLNYFVASYSKLLNTEKLNLVNEQLLKMRKNAFILKKRIKCAEQKGK